MAKAKKIAYFCSNCGYESSKWEGKCPSCNEWNTFSEEVINPISKSLKKSITENPPVSLSKVESQDTKRTKSGMEELDRVLGGGIVPGSLVLLGGDPGIGKSTLLLQLCSLIDLKGTILYVSGEESKGQIKMRADRMGEFSPSVKILCETDTEVICAAIESEKPSLVIVDSIQTMYSSDISSPPGSVSQVREGTNVFMQTAKQKSIPIFLVGHVTKEGAVAGPRMLEHMVDTVLYFEGDKYASYRVLRSVKNRFGSTNEIGVFEMLQNGLREVKNPSEFMLYGRPKDASGSVVTCTMEGTRPVLIEIQALVCKSNFGMPRRSASGCDPNRVNLLMAVLEKRLSLPLGEFDAYINVAGGMKLKEPAIDLGIVLAILSSFKNRIFNDSFICFGEVGLNGEVRSVSQAASRIKEAKKLGFTSCILPKNSLGKSDVIEGVKLFPIESVFDAYRLIDLKDRK